ncbi:MAG: thymidine phosphorylase, partial [archaeon GB-1867-035]|nr:thymidine phosphorylase [Candidatus Culexmicrobium profundum]
VLVPIVAAADYTIPKTSSRAITSPAGTADRMEVLCPVNLSLEEIEKVVNKVNACIVWGGALDLAPADDLFIQVEYPLAIDPLLLPSIISKKKAMEADYVVIDIPTGRGAKIKTIGEAHELAKEFIELGRRLDMNIQCAITFGEQPLGYAIGPALEAREALLTLMGKGPKDLEEKAINLAGILFEMVGESNGKKKAREILRKGLAERKLREIIEAQGGNPKIKIEDIPIGREKAIITAAKEGRIVWINNRDIAHLARTAGAPKDKGAGILLNVKLGDYVKKGDKLFTIYAERLTKLEEAIKLTEQLEVIGISKDIRDLMLIERIPTEKIHEKTFILER